MRGGGLRLFANGSGHLWGWHPTALDIITKLGRQLAIYIYIFPIIRLEICQKIYTTQFSGNRILHTENA